MWKKESPEPVTDLFYIKDESGSGLTVTVTPSTPVNATLYYSLNATDWTALNIDGQTTAVTFNVPANKKVWMKGSFDGASGYYTITGSDDHSIGGNILSICDETNYQSMTTIPSKAFYHRFYGDSHLTYSDNVTFGIADTVNSSGMSGMFQNCTSLYNSPDTSGITTIQAQAFRSMFEGCSSFYNPPAINLTSVPQMGMYCMFKDCTSMLYGMPLDSITYIASGNSGYYAISYLYGGCTSLSAAYAPNITNWSTSAMNLSESWLSGVSASGTLYCPSQTVADAIPDNSTSGCPSGWQKVSFS